MKIPRRVKLGAGVALAMVLIFAGYLAYRFFTHGPPALARAKVPAPAAVLRYGNAPSQFLEVRLPGGSGPFPAAILIHGGCWNTTYGSVGDMRPLAEALRERGIATFNIGYRRVGEAGGGWPGTFQDVGAAIDAVRSVAPRYAVDLHRLAVAGHSAGALLALWTATRNKLQPSSAVYVANPATPTAVVAIDGPASLSDFIGLDADICGAPAIVPLMGGTPQQVPQRYRDATPQDHLPLGIPQFVVRGGMKQPVDRYVALARAAGDAVQFAEPSRATHFDVLMPWQKQGEPALDFVTRAVRQPAQRSPH